MATIQEIVERARKAGKSTDELLQAAQIAGINLPNIGEQTESAMGAVNDPITRDTTQNRQDTMTETTPGMRQTTPTEEMSGQIDFGDTGQGQQFGQFQGEGVFSARQQKPTQDFVSLRGDEAFLKFGQQAVQQEQQTPGFLRSRNDALAQDFARRGVTDPMDIFTELREREGFASTDVADQENTVRAITQRIGQLGQQQEEATQMRDTEFGDMLSRTREQADRETETQVQDFLQDVSRGGQLYDRKLEDLQTRFNRNEEELDRQRQEFSIKVDNEIKDIMRSAERNVSIGEKVGALKGFARSSGYMQGLQNIRNDALRNVERLQAQKERALAATEEDRERLWQDYNKSIDRAKEDFDFEMRDLMDLANVEVQGIIDKYGFSDEKLGEKIAEISLDVEERRQNVINSYINNMSSINAVKSQEIDDIIKVQNFYNQQEDRFSSLLNQNGGEALLNLSPTQLIDYVEQGYLSPQSAQAYADVLYGKTVSTLQTMGTPTTEDIATVTSLLNGGMSPAQAIAQIVEANPSRFTAPAEAPDTIKTDDGTFQFNPSTGRYDIKVGGGDLDAFVYSGDFTEIDKDFRDMASQFPGEASVKNNNPAGITFNERFAETLRNNGIEFSKGTPRPANEGGNYFSFPTLGEGFKAYNLLRQSPSYSNLTIEQALNRWNTGDVNRGYGQQITSIVGVNPNMRVSDLPQSDLQAIQAEQLRRESPGMYNILQEAVQNPVNEAIDNSLSNIAPSLSKNARETTIESMQNYLQSGDIDNAKTLLVNTLSATLKGDERKQADFYNTVGDTLENLESAFESYIAAGGNTGVLEGAQEKVAAKIGRVKDPQLRSLASRIQSALQQYRLAISGAAFSEQEAAEYEALFPSIGDYPALNRSKIEGLLDTVNDNKESFISRKIGENNYEIIFGEAQDGDGGEDNVQEGGTTLSDIYN